MMNTRFHESAVKLTRQIDELVFQLDGNGRNFQERTDSIHHLLTNDEIQELKSIAAENHQLVFSDGFATQGDRREFLDRCHWMVDRLEVYLETPAKQPRASSSMNRLPGTNNSRFIVTAMGLTCFLLLALLVNQAGLAPHLTLTIPSPWMVTFWAVTALLVTFAVTTRLARRRSSFHHG